MKAKSEIEQVKEATYNRLIGMGYDPAAVSKLVNSFWKVTRYFNGEPSMVITEDGQEIYL